MTYHGSGGAKSRPLLRRALAVVLALAVIGLPGSAAAHSGGLDSDGGHYCGEAGYEAGTCSPLGSYHCHQSPCGDGESEPDHDHVDVYEPARSASSGTTMRARRMLIKIASKRERRGGSYDRSRFGGWTDANADGCDTRQAVLISESRVRASRKADCTVTGGRWFSVYDGRSWTNPSDVDIDHVVALREAWVSGAYGWSRSTRRRFANDLRFQPSLRAVTDNVNQSKGDRDPAEWLPTRAQCRYAINWVQVKFRWRLTANQSERSALGSILSGDCGHRRVDVPLRGR